MPAASALKLDTSKGLNHESSGMRPSVFSESATPTNNAMMNHSSTAIWKNTVMYWKILVEVMPR